MYRTKGMKLLVKGLSIDELTSIHAAVLNLTCAKCDDKTFSCTHSTPCMSYCEVVSCWPVSCSGGYTSKPGFFG